MRQSTTGNRPECDRLSQVTPHTRRLRGCQHFGAAVQTEAIVEGSGGFQRLARVGSGQGSELFNHDFRLSATDNPFDRIGIKYISDRWFNTLFHQGLSFFWRTRQSNDGVSFGKQLRDQRTTYCSCSSGNEYLHVSLLLLPRRERHF